MNYADIKQCDVANGPGVRVSLFVSGCTHKCKGCFNAEAWDFEYGQLFDEAAEKKLIDSLKSDYITGLSLLGGEPFEPQNCERLLPLLEKIKRLYPQKDIWCYSGYTLENDILSGKLGANAQQMITLIDVLVDGEFVEEKKDLHLRFRGSDNQRIIDVASSLKLGKTVLWSGQMYI